ncbi:MAG: sel1 repeat family protein [Gammaproteobacteria bacterium]|nr:sel1 repeat family protein [Gammaproteobacteria bacterium]
MASDLYAHGFIPLPLETVENIESKNKANNFNLNINATTIKQDIDALLDKRKSQEAVQRLIARGNSIIPALMKVVSSDQLEYELKSTVLFLIYKVADQSDVSTVIKVTEIMEKTKQSKKATSRFFPYVYAFRALEKFEQTEEILAFVNKQLENEHRDPSIQAPALRYFIKKPNKVAFKWVKQYTTDKTKPETRYNAYYLGAMMGLKVLKYGVIDLLKNPPESSVSYKYEILNLQKGLIELTSLTEFNEIIKNNNITISDQKVHRYLYLRRGDQQQRKQVVDEVMPNTNKETNETIDYLIAVNDADPLAQHWQFANPWLKEKLLNAGLEISINEQGASFVKAAKSQEQKLTKQNTPDEIAVAVAKSLTSNDKQKFIETLEVDKSVQALLGIKHLPELTTDWQVLVNEASKSGVNFSEISYVANSYQIMVGRNRLQVTDIEIAFTNKGRYFSVMLPGCVYINEKWSCTQSIQWQDEINNSKDALKWLAVVDHKGNKKASHEFSLLADKSDNGIIKWMKMLASYGDGSMQYKLYQAYMRQITSSAKNEALQWLYKAADSGDGRARYDLSMFLSGKKSGLKIKVDIEKSRHYLEKASDSFHLYGMLESAENYAGGVNGFPLDLTKAENILKRIAYTDTALIVGEADIRRIEDYKKTALINYNKLTSTNLASKNNDPKSLKKLAVMHLRNNNPDNYKKGLAYFEQAAKNDADIAHELGVNYGYGRSNVKKDSDKAIYWLQFAAKQNHIQSLEILAHTYMGSNAFNVVKSPEKAQEYTKALTRIYNNGLFNTPMNLSEANFWEMRSTDLQREIDKKNGEFDEYRYNELSRTGGYLDVKGWKRGDASTKKIKTYLNIKNNEEVIELYEKGYFYTNERGNELTGKYISKPKTIVFEYGIAMDSIYTVNNNRITGDGNTWELKR